MYMSPVQLHGAAPTPAQDVSCEKTPARGLPSPRSLTGY